MAGHYIFLFNAMDHCEIESCLKNLNNIQTEPAIEMVFTTEREASSVL